MENSKIISMTKEGQEKMIAPTVKMTYMELRTALPALQKLFGQEFTSMKFLIKLKKMLDECDRELKYFEDVRFQLIQHYGEESKDENGQSVWKVKPENNEIFMKELEETLNTEVGLKIDLITYDELEKYSEGLTLKLSAIDIKALEKFIMY